VEIRETELLTFQLDLSQPIYEQIMQQMCSAIARGKLSLGEKIPSVREMAIALKVNPNTVMHAYKEMEREGLTETRRGQGTFITTSQDRIQEFRRVLSKEVVEEFIEKMTSLGHSKQEILHQIQNGWI
jgi:GntR family transcriptional regulator